MCIDGLPHIVAHELIHFEQPPIPNDQRTLLAQTVHEGSADFLGELISGRHINGHIHEYCLPREAELWAEFKEEMNGTDIGGWMYGGQPEGRPADIGYFFGYRIAEAYYNQADDKKKAIRDILLIDDFNEFLAASGYAPQGFLQRLTDEVGVAGGSTSDGRACWGQASLRGSREPKASEGWCRSRDSNSDEVALRGF